MPGLRNYMDLMQDYCISSLRCNEGKSHSDADAEQSRTFGNGGTALNQIFRCME